MRDYRFCQRRQNALVQIDRTRNEQTHRQFHRTPWAGGIKQSISPLSNPGPKYWEIIAGRTESARWRRGKRGFQSVTTELSFFLPLYNEEANVSAVAGRAVAALEQSGLEWELILVDDGSADATGARAREICRDPRVRLESHPYNRGYGAALKTGFASARGELVGFCDGDGQFDPADVAKLLALIEGNDMVIGFRRRRAEGSTRALPSRAWAALAGALLGFSPRDLDCGFKLFRSGFVRSLDLESDGGFISAEMLAKANKLGASIAEVGLDHYPRRAGNQTGLNPLVVARAFWDLLRFYGRLRSWPR